MTTRTLSLAALTVSSLATTALAADDVFELTYSLSYTNLSATPTTYLFSYSEAITPSLVGEYALMTSISGGLANFGRGTGAYLLPVDGYIQKLSFSTDGGATFFSAGADVGPSFTLAPSAGTGTKPYGEYSVWSTGLFDLPVNYWKFDVSYVISPGRDAVGLTGYAQLVPIPEPTSVALILGTAGLLVAVRKRRQNASS